MLLLPDKDYGTAFGKQRRKVLKNPYFAFLIIE